MSPNFPGLSSVSLPPIPSLPLRSRNPATVCVGGYELVNHGRLKLALNVIKKWGSCCQAIVETQFLKKKKWFWKGKREGAKYNFLKPKRNHQGSSVPAARVPVSMKV